MSQYYFDLETTGFNPEKDKIITIQFQELNDLGIPKAPLTILKEWESSEEKIIEEIHKRFFDYSYWHFIPIGTNLIFDLTFLFTKFKKYNLDSPELSKFLYNKPNIDIKDSLVLANSMNFKGSGLDNMTNKKTDGRNIPIWHGEKKFNLIEDYIKQETESFIEFLQKLISKLKELKNDKKED